MNRLDWGVVVLGAGKLDAVWSQATGHTYKALLPFDGRPSGSYAIQACFDAGCDVIALAAPEEVTVALEVANVRKAPPGESNLRSARNGVELLPEATALLLLSSDAPLIEGPHVQSFFESVRSWVSQANTDKWVAIGVVRLDEAREAFPDAPFAFQLRFREGRFLPGTLYAVSRRAFEECFAYFEEGGNRRKSKWAMLRMIGIGNALRYVLGRVSLSEASSFTERILGVKALVVSDCHPHTAMDCDTAEDHEYLQGWMSKGSRGPR